MVRAALSALALVSAGLGAHPGAAAGEGYRVHKPVGVVVGMTIDYANDTCSNAEQAHKRLDDQ